MLNKENELLAWLECYVFKINEDPHQTFADMLGVSRIDAKRKCYEIAHTVSNSPVMKAYY